MTNFMQYFKEEREVYIQNVAPGQVSMQFGRGDDALSFTLTRKHDPIVLTNHVPFKAIKESTDFRKLVNRQPALVRLLSQEEYDAYYAAKAKAAKKTVEAVIQEAEASRLSAKAQVAAPVSTAPAKEDDSVAAADVNIDDKVVSAEEVIHGRVLTLCNQVSEQIPEADRMKPNDLLSQLKDLEAEFKFDDFEYIVAHTSSKMIHNWAKSKQKVLATAAAV